MQKIIAGWWRRILVYMKQDHPLKFDGAVTNAMVWYRKAFKVQMVFVPTKNWAADPPGKKNKARK